MNGWKNTLLCMALCCLPLSASAGRFVETPYEDPKAVFDFYFDDPRHIESALYWLRAYINPLTESPYDLAPEMMDIVVVIHGTELVTVATKNYEKYRNAVDRMRYYALLGVKFRVCGLAAADYGYRTEDFQDFIEVAPSAITELGHWQQQGYALITPRILEKRFRLEEIR
ncbi:DsrE family protein [endosymbiont of unidentified scaly snail isolate Monju]|uniref:DsrE family protein n=1 Tax=endosymbiont of unidentified scaly snail isolate Monju TaxID=1248727 RepID=UPI0003892399|nr:DsrE family protein [endosymbiont of unidentified scaly snail isolate Monju]BAN69444.1 conserved hypothetical protein [endosymbiont of unidentified scaly snail isolate Monju]